MGNLKEIKNRIASVLSICQITRAMKMIASSKISKAEALLKARIPYTKHLVSIMSEVSRQTSEVVHPLMSDEREHKKIGIFVVTSDKGLCGAYNMNVLKKAEELYYDCIESDCEPVLYLLGTKATLQYDRRKIPYRWGRQDWEADDDFADILYSMLVRDFLDGVFDILHIIYASAKSRASYVVVEKQLLPFEPEFDDEQDSSGNVIFEPSAEEAVNLIVPMTLKQIIITALLDARFAEYGSRIVAMTNATENAEQLVSDLRLKFFRARQEAITTEILEVSAAAAQLQESE